jgi:CDP-glucose 4,6-dehydratase
MEIETNFWEHRKVFITGATGLLGSEITKELITKKANVIALVRDFVPKSRFFTESLNKKVTSVHGSLSNYRLIERTLNEYEIDTVIHLGAQTIVTTANRSPISTFESNIRGTWNILEACRNSKNVNRIAIASSDKAYGSAKFLPYDEKHPLEGEYPYDVSKSCADLISQSYFKTYGLPVGVTRCGNFYGPGDLNFNRIIPDTIRSLFLNKQPVIRSDGSLIRDYIFIKDGANAYLTLLENLDRKEIKGKAFNFSTGNKLSVLQLVKKISELFPSNLQPLILNEVKGEIKDQYLDSKKAKELLNWEPKYSLDESLRITIEWYKEFLGSEKINLEPTPRIIENKSQTISPQPSFPQMNLRKNSIFQF